MSTLGSSFIDDGVAVEVNGEVVMETAAQVQASFPGQTMTPTANFSFSWNGSTISYVSGETQIIAANLLAALTAAGAPFTQP